MNFDSLMGKVKQSVSAGAKKTEQVVNVSKLKLEAGKINSEIKGLYEKLGRSVYEMRSADQSDEQLLISLCEEVDALFLREKTLKQEIALLEGVIICSSCAHHNKKGSLFCTNCGEKLAVLEPTAEVVSANSSITCGACATVNTGDGLFCTSCGAKLSVVVAEPTSAEVPAAEPSSPDADFVSPEETTQDG